MDASKMSVTILESTCSRSVQFLILFSYLFISVQSASGQGTTADQYEPEELHQHFKNEAMGYAMQADDTKYELRSQPLMHWQNPERNQELGATFVWETDGVPRVLASIFTFEYNRTVRCRHEMISLSDRPFDSSLHSERVWSPKKAGLEWKPVDGFVPPAQSSGRRLFQLRTIARQFKGNVNYEDKAPAQLSLIPQPLIRYQSEKLGVLDGAIFSLAIATDPEILLVIEASRDESGVAAFRYAAVRSNFNELELHRNGKRVWNTTLIPELRHTRANQRPWSDDPFFVFTPSRPLPTPGSID